MGLYVYMDVGGEVRVLHMYIEERFVRFGAILGRQITCSILLYK